MLKTLSFSLSIAFFCSVAYGQVLYEDRASVLGILSNTGTTVFGGSGVSFVDYNNDGFDDITLATGDNTPVRFYKNLDGTFFTEENLLPVTGNYNYKTRSITWVDYDNDGDKDLFLTSDTDGNRLFNKQSTGLVDVTLFAGFPIDNIHTYGASWGDIDNDGCLDVYLSNRIGGTSITNYFFKNNCDGTFSNLTDVVGLTNEPALTFCSAFFDFNNDGYQDLYVANDKFKPNYLYKNNGDGTFTDVSASSGTGIVVDAMSVTVDDYNNDGYFDVFITNTPNSISTPTLGSVLLKNNGDETFTDVSISTGVSLDSFSWGSSFLDSENDGDLDIYVNCQYTSSDALDSYAFFKNDAYTFSQPTNVGFTTNDHKSYSCAIGDYNNDGKLDIISNNDDNTLPSLWTDTSVFNTNNYLSIALEGNMSNKDGIGSIIEISIGGNKQYRTVLGGEGYMAQNSLTAHFGVGGATTIDSVKVKWLSGLEDILYNVSVNQKLSIVEGTALSTTDFDAVSSLNYYPNPAKDFLKLESSQEIERIIIFDALGKQVLQDFPMDKEFDIELSILRRGHYFMRVFQKSDVKTIKVVKL
ncbi:FG-GAP-like repeat-containing protein [Winogradskyella jejuensis]|uniref:Por secretion system C-terminal sorting domain-containing protein n=1 Tax=Winogradskyella jejuensis TaxID=1089305 RepID=A0A1M5VP02_9FLAO|nr:FG-GAP-like repeat-containing protein [Winogradskyella jejuensis]SHH76957.1 Por secretion system C-terminal sorting domain-containing protein [Winogradskyella jejuensis]